MKSALIIGDSLSLSRIGDGIAYKDIFYAQLVRAFPGRLIVNGSLRANNSRMVLTESYLSEYVHSLSPDVVILQLGIVDCTPRIFSDLERKLLHVMQQTRALKGIAEKIIDRASKWRYELTRRRGLTLVPAAEFEQNVSRLVHVLRDLNRASRFMYINVPCPSGTMVERNSGVRQAVEKYNQILNAVFSKFNGKEIDLYSYTRDVPEALLPDGYHITNLAHAYLADQISVQLIESNF